MGGAGPGSGIGRGKKRVVGAGSGGRWWSGCEGSRARALPDRREGDGRGAVKLGVELSGLGKERGGQQADRPPPGRRQAGSSRLARGLGGTHLGGV